MKISIFVSLILFVSVGFSYEENIITQEQHKSGKVKIDQVPKGRAIGSNRKDQNKFICIPDSNIFLLKHCKETVDKNDVVLVKQLQNLNKNQINCWINPIPELFKYNLETQFKYYKAAAFQNATHRYSAILIMMVEDIVLNQVIAQQVLITVDSTGKYVNALPVQYLKNLSNSSVEFDTVRKVYSSSTDVRSSFNGDTIKVYQLVDVSNLKEPHTDEEVWQELYEIIYLINPDGKIENVRERKKVKDSREKR